MIEVYVEPYCQDCPEFEAKAQTRLLQHVGDVVVKARTIIYCEHRDRCREMVCYLKAQVEKECD